MIDGDLARVMERNNLTRNRASWSFIEGPVYFVHLSPKSIDVERC